MDQLSVLRREKSQVHFYPGLYTNCMLGVWSALRVQKGQETEPILKIVSIQWSIDKSILSAIDGYLLSTCCILGLCQVLRRDCKGFIQI